MNRFHSAWVVARSAIVGALLVAASGCDNRPTAARQALPLFGDFRAYHVVDEVFDPPVVIDTTHLYVLGSGLGGDIRVKVNDVALAVVAQAQTEAIYARTLPIDAGGVLTLSVATAWQSAVNSITAPVHQPVLTQPVSARVYERVTGIPVRWTEGDTGTVRIELSRGGADGRATTLLWSEETTAGDENVVIPASVWETNSDTTAIVSVWNVVRLNGDGFEGGLFMTASLAVRRLIHIRAEGTVGPTERPTNDSNLPMPWQFSGHTTPHCGPKEGCITCSCVEYLPRELRCAFSSVRQPFRTPRARGRMIL